MKHNELHSASMKLRRVPNPTNVRLSDNTKTSLRTLSDRFGVTPSDLIRAAVNQKLPEWEEKGVILLARKSHE